MDNIYFLLKINKNTRTCYGEESGTKLIPVNPVITTTTILNYIIYMNSDSKLLVSTLKGAKGKRTPFWFMRQAGRYLPEYRELRARHRNFLEFCYTPEAAVEATLQPIRRFGMDGAIIFSDILVVPHALGQEVRFDEGHGPVLSPVRSEADLAKLNQDKISEFLSPVYEALRLVKKSLPEETALIGFAGAPWTIASYMIEGGGSKEFSHIRNLSENDEAFFARLIDLVTDSVIIHLSNQVKAGAEVIQIFDSWAGIASESGYRRWCIAPTKKIVAALKKEFPQVPIIGFPRQSGDRYLSYARETGVDAVSFDGSVPRQWVREKLQPMVVVQGCLPPDIMAGDTKILLAEAARILETFGDKAFVFNLSHGIVPSTPVANMQALCEYLKAR